MNYPQVQVVVAEHARRTPDATAVVHGGTQLSYSDLDGHANRLAGALAEHGVGPDTVVAVQLHRDPWWVVACLAVLRAGGAYLAIDPDHPAERRRLLMTRARATVVVTWGTPEPVELPGVSPDARGTLVAPRVPDACLAYVIHTSGSTGEPKPVALTRGGLARLVAWHRERHRIVPADRVAQTASQAFDASVWEVWSTLAAGATLYLAGDEDRRDPARLVRWLVRHRITAAFLATPLAAEVLQADLPDNLALRTLLTGGDTLRRPPAGHIPFEVVNHYGPTEATVVATAGTVTADSVVPPPIGQAIDGTEALVLADGVVVPHGVRGELHLGGPQLARGYLHQPALTAERFVPHPHDPGQRLYRTGDLVHQDADGTLHFHGRVDAQLSVRGHRIEPGEIEHALLAVGVGAAAVVLHEETLVAYVTGRDAAEVRAELARHLPHHLLPSAVVTLPELPLTTSGKVDRAELAAAALPVATTGARTDDPTTRRVVEMMAGVLGRTEIGPDDDFFALGGHSLSLTRLLAAVLAEFEVAVPVGRVFERPSANGIAALLTADEADTRPIRRVPADDTVPLSSPQRRLWFIHQLAPDLCAYNEHAAYRLSGPVDVAALRTALDAVVLRHESMRTGIETRAGEPVLRVMPAYRVPLDIVDTTPTAAVRALSARPFDLASGRLLRAVLVPAGPDVHTLVLSLHHIAADEWSLRILVRDLGTAYAAARAGASPRHRPLPFRYVDFAAWQGCSAEDMAYWRRQLAGAPPVLELPTDRPRPPVPGFAGDRVAFEVPADVVERIGSVARHLSATRFMVLLAAFQVLLHRYTSATDIVLGTPVSGRGRAEFTDLVGFFVNTLVLRTDLAGDPTFTDVVARARETTLAALAHQEVPFERLVEELAPDRDPSGHPLFRVVFAVDEEPRAELRLPGVVAEPWDTHDGTAKFDLTLTLRFDGDRLTGAFDYRVDLFDRATVDRMAEHFRNLLTAATHRPDRRMSTLPMLSTQEEALLSAWNDTVVPQVTGLVPDWVRERATEQPDAVAVSEVDSALTYGELAARARAVAGHLRARGVTPETVVALFFDRGVDLTVAMLGVLWAGGAYLPLDTTHPPERLRHVLTDARANLVLSGRALPVDTEVLRLGELLDDPPPWTWVSPSPDQLAYVIYTSGSTGRPKGVGVSHRGLANLVSWHLAAYAVDGRDRATQIAATGFDACAWETWTALAAGAALHVPSDDDRLRPDRLLAWLADERVTVAFLPTPLAERVLALAEPAGLVLRLMLTGGDTLSGTPSHSATYTLVNHYGPTESSVVATAVPVDPGSGVPSIGRPIHNTRVYVLDRWSNPVPVGVPGDLHLAGTGLARGYLHQPEATAAAFRPDPFGGPGSRMYRTGDRARWRPDGTLEFLGRSDHQVKIRGFRIELGEVEAAIRAYPGVGDVVVAAGDGPGGRRLVGYLTGQVDTAALDAAVRRRLPEYAVPSALVHVDQLPTTANGKIDRAALPPPRSSHPEAILGPVERVVRRVWTAVLGVDDIGVAENFFVLGGHSLLATQAVARLNEVFGVELPVRTLFTAPTVAGVAAVLREHETEPGRLVAIAELHELVDDLGDDEVQRMLADALNEGTPRDE